MILFGNRDAHEWVACIGWGLKSNPWPPDRYNQTFYCRAWSHGLWIYGKIFSLAVESWTCIVCCDLHSRSASARCEFERSPATKRFHSSLRSDARTNHCAPRLRTHFVTSLPSDVTTWLPPFPDTSSLEATTTARVANWCEFWRNMATSHVTTRHCRGRSLACLMTSPSRHVWHLATRLASIWRHLTRRRNIRTPSGRFTIIIIIIIIIAWYESVQNSLPLTVWDTNEFEDAESYS